MARRVHELAKELEVETKEIIARLEKIGLTGKRSQSSVKDEDIEKLRQGLAAEEKPGVTIGQEREVTGVAGQLMVERRVKKNVIRRRAQSSGGPAPSLDLMEPIQPVPSAEEPLDPLIPAALAPGVPETPAYLPVSDLPETLLPAAEVPPVSGLPPSLPGEPAESQEIPLDDESWPRSSLPWTRLWKRPNHRFLPTKSPRPRR